MSATKRGTIAATVLIVLLTAIFWARILFGGKIFYVHDITKLYYPIMRYSLCSLLQGKVPLWTHGLGCGFPILAEGQAGVFYPVNIISFLILLPERALSGALVFHFFLAGLFMYLFVRSLARTNAAALVSAIIFMFSGFMICHTIHPNMIAAYVWLPLLLLCFFRAINRRSPGFSLLGGLVISLQVLAGHPQMVFFSVLTILFYSIFVSAKKDAAGNRAGLTYSLGLFLFAVVVGLCLSMVQILPTYELTAQSARSAGTPLLFMTWMSLPFENLATLLMPYLFGNPIADGYVGKWNFHELCGYMGILPLLLAYIALKLKRDREMLFFAFMGTASIVLALGGHTPLYRLLQYIPGFNMFRVPARYLSLFVLALAVLAGFGIDRLLNMPRGEIENRLLTFKKVVIWLVVVCVVLSIVLFLVKAKLLSFSEGLVTRIYHGEAPTFLNRLISGQAANALSEYIRIVNVLVHSLMRSMISFTVTLCLGIALLALFIRGKLKRRTFIICVVIFIIADLWYFGIRYTPVASPRIYREKAEVVKLIENDRSLFRILVHERDVKCESPQEWVRQLPGNLSLVYKLDNVFSWTPLYVKRYLAFLELVTKPWQETVDPRLLDLLNVKYVLSSGGVTSSGLKLIRGGEPSLYENQDFFPRAFLVKDIEIISGGDQILARLSEEDFNPMKTAIFEEEPVMDKGIESSQAEVEKVSLIRYDPRMIDLDLSLRDDSYLIITNTYYPGWEAYIDGERVRIYRVDFAFQGIPVARGRHRVKLAYRPRSFKMGLYISLITAIFLVTSLLYLGKRKA